MKRGSEYAKRVKQLHQQMTRQYGKPDIPEPTDPIHQLIIGILAECASESKAASVFNRVCEQMVDLNELRVTPAMELADTMGNGIPMIREKAERIIRVLNEIRLRQDTLDLSFLKQRGRREARTYLESLEGVGIAASASVMVHSLNGHAIPVDYLTVYVLRKEEVVDSEANAADVQGFLERNVSANDARAFSILLNKHVATEGSRVQVQKLPEILHLPPPEPLKTLGKTMAQIGGDRIAPLPVVKVDEPDLADLESIELDPELAAELQALERAAQGNHGSKGKHKDAGKADGKKPAHPPAKPAAKKAEAAPASKKPEPHKPEPAKAAAAKHAHPKPPAGKPAKPADAGKKKKS